MSSYGKTANPVPARGDRIIAKAAARPLLLRSTLALEAIVVFFALLVAHGLKVAHPGMIWGIGISLILLLIALSRYMDDSRMIIVASIAQLALIAIGFIIPLMFIVGIAFVLLWIASLVIGQRIDRERTEWDTQHPELAPNVTSQ